MEHLEEYLLDEDSSVVLVILDPLIQIDQVTLLKELRVFGW